MSDDQGELHDLRSTVEEMRRLAAGLREDLAQIRAISAALAERFEHVVGTLEERLGGVATAEQVDRLGVDLRTHLSDAAGSLDGEAIVADLATVRAQLGDGRGTIIEQLQDHLTEVASGEVVGALWDEVRAVREAVDGLDGSDGLGGQSDGPHVDLSPVLDSLATLRAELAEGLVAEPSEALSSSLDAVRAELDGLRAVLADLPERNARTTGPSAELVATVHDEIATVRGGVDEIRRHLDEWMAGTRDEAQVRAGDAHVEVLADQIAALRDLVSSEVDGLRQVIAARPDEADDQPHVALTSAPAGPVALDDGTLEVLRDEIRTAGAIGDQVIDALREELRALRRRIAVKATERVLDDDQLAQIADAVAARLAKG